MSDVSKALQRFGPRSLGFLLLSACSMPSISPRDASISEPTSGRGIAKSYVQVDTALPDTLAAPDAHAISAAAAKAISFSAPSSSATWQNAETGSSGTLVAVAAPVRLDGVPCRTFRATVTSLQGVHLYVVTVCHVAGGVSLRSVRDSDGAQLSPGQPET